MSLISLALNKNLTEAEFIELSQKRIESSKKLSEDVFSKSKTIKCPIARAKYIQKCIPLLIMTMF